MASTCVAGKWNVVAVPESGKDTTATKYILTATSDTTGWAITFTLKAAAHIRPDESDADTRAAALSAFQDIMKPCIQQGKDGAIQIDNG